MDDALESFLAIAQRIVYATLATVDPRGRPRSRIVHPVWELEEGRLVGWVGTRPSRLKRESLGFSGFASCLYWDHAHDVAVAECAAAWAPPERRREAWERLAAAGEPYTVWQDG
jgi:hypothetical protein